MKLSINFHPGLHQNNYITLPYHRNFTYFIDKRNWKYYFLMLALCKGW
jgi:hypothetical protein